MVRQLLRPCVVGLALAGLVQVGGERNTRVVGIKKHQRLSHHAHAKRDIQASDFAGCSRLSVTGLQDATGEVEDAPIFFDRKEGSETVIWEEDISLEEKPVKPMSVTLSGEDFTLAVPPDADEGEPQVTPLSLKQVGCEDEDFMKKQESKDPVQAESQDTGIEKPVDGSEHSIDKCDHLAWKGEVLFNKAGHIEEAASWKVENDPNKNYVLWRKDGHLRVSQSSSELNTKARGFEESQLVCVTAEYQLLDACTNVRWQDGAESITFSRVPPLDPEAKSSMWATAPDASEQLTLWFRVNTWYVSPTDHKDEYFVKEFSAEDARKELSCQGDSSLVQHSEAHKVHSYKHFSH